MQGASKHSILAVICNKVAEDKQKQDVQYDKLRYPFAELASSGRLEQVHTLISPTADEFSRTYESIKPNAVYFQGEELPNEEIGSIKWGDFSFSTSEAISALFSSTLPTVVYLETPDGEELAEPLYSKGVPFVIYWKKSFSRYAALHFVHAFFLVMQSSSCHPWNAFQLAQASFRLYCIRNNLGLPTTTNEQSGGKVGPCFLGGPPIIDVVMPEIEAAEDEDNSEGTLSAVKIHDDEVSVKFLVCGEPHSSDAYSLHCLEDGLNALLSIEMHGSKLQNRFSAPPPPHQAGAFSRGVVTMRCDISTSSAAHISLLVSGSAQTCFDDQLLENHIKKEVVERSQLVHAVSTIDETLLSEPRKSAAVACGATVFEVCMRVPSWALQVLRQLACESSYRGLVALGIASIQGLAVASFTTDDAQRLLFFCTRQRKDFDQLNATLPSWLRSPAPCQKCSDPCHGTSLNSYYDTKTANYFTANDKASQLMNEISLTNLTTRRKSRTAAMRPIPHTYPHKMIPFIGFGLPDVHEGGQAKTSLAAVQPAKHSLTGSSPARCRKFSIALQTKQLLSVNPGYLKKHGCSRAPIHLCSEEEFLKDVMHFLTLRGHTRLIPQSGLVDFPDAVLNTKRLDLYNLYREVVSRGGFHVGNGINWKGQIFSKMRNYTATNKMTGVGNTLKRHYETYLLEYELAHDDVDGECCLICHSSAAGDWVNCGICGEWAHFGCDRRQGLGAFKDYAKTDGLEYICPSCSVSNFKKKLHKSSNGFLDALTYS